MTDGALVRQDTTGTERVRAKPHGTSAQNPAAILDMLSRKGACLGRKLLCRAPRPELERHLFWDGHECFPSSYSADDQSILEAGGRRIWMSKRAAKRRTKSLRGEAEDNENIEGKPSTKQIMWADHVGSQLRLQGQDRGRAGGETHQGTNRGRGC